MRFYHDDVNEQYGWIDGEIADLIPGEIINEEKFIVKSGQRDELENEKEAA